MKSALARALLLEPRFDADVRRFGRAMHDVNCAHVLMLVDQGLISQQRGNTLLAAIRLVFGNLTDRVRLGTGEDFYFAFERAVLEVAGSDGGDLHIGRSRNDITATVCLIELRDQVNSIRANLLDLCRNIHRLAKLHSDTLMPGYTHLRSAQPTTLGHYLVGVGHGLRRDVERFAGVYEHLSACPMGAVAFGGTSHAIRRDTVAEMLGFGEPWANSLDAVAARDVFMSFLGAAAILGSTLARFVQDIYVWSTSEFGFVSLDEELTGISSVMPQKRNPVILERCRAKASILFGAFAAGIGALKGTAYFHSQDVSVDATGQCWSAAEEAKAFLQLLSEVVRTLQVDRDRMRQRSGAEFSTSTEIADFLVREHDIPFRRAHEIVSQAVSSIRGASAGPQAWKAALSHELGPDALVPSEIVLRDLLDPEASVARRRSAGSPSPKELQSSLAAHERWLDSTYEEVSDEMSRLDLARTRLSQVANRNP